MGKNKKANRSISVGLLAPGPNRSLPVPTDVSFLACLLLASPIGSRPKAWPKVQQIRRTDRDWMGLQSCENLPPAVAATLVLTTGASKVMLKGG